MAETDPLRSWESTLDRPTPAAFARVTALVRGTDVRERGEQCLGRLLRLVAAWGPDTALEITYGATRARGNTATLELRGVVPPTWLADLAWAWDGVATVRGRQAEAVEPPGPVHELRPRRALLPRLGQRGWDGADAVQDELLRNARLRGERPWPIAMHAALAELLALNVAPASPGLVIRTRLAGASELEREMLREELLATYTGRTDVAEYLGVPVRMRVLVSSRSALPARARAQVSEWGSELELVALHELDADAAWTGEPLSLAGYAVPRGTALAGLRVPVAGPAAFPGMPTAHAVAPGRPLDPVPPRPRSPLQIGRARTADHRWVPVLLDTRDLLQHTFVQGMSGAGKSTLLTTVAAGVTDAGGTVTVLDPEGSTIDLLLGHLRPEHAARTRVVRHGTDDLDAPLNLLGGDPRERERMVDLFAEMIQRSQDPRGEGIVGPRWRRWFTLISLATATVLGEQASLVAVAAIASDVSRVRALAKSVKEVDPDLAHRLLQEYGRLDGKEAVDLTSWAMSKLQEVIGGERARWIFGAGPDGVDVVRALDEGENLLIDLGAHRLGEPVSRAIGATYLLKHWAALGARRDRSRPHVIVVDEAHLFRYGALPRLLAEARKFGVGVVVATQHLGQLTGELADALESNTGTFVSLRCGLSSASRASVRLSGWPTDELVRLPDLTAAVTVTRNGVLTAPFTLELDQHARMRRLAAKGVVGEHVAASVLAASRETAASFASLHPPTDLEIGRVLATDGRPDRPERPMRPPPPPDQDSIDRWLATHGKGAVVDG